MVRDGSVTGNPLGFISLVTGLPLSLGRTIGSTRNGHPVSPSVLQVPIWMSSNAKVKITCQLWS
jgi:hypothetical protein